jgi:hypothetical protein
MPSATYTSTTASTQAPTATTVPTADKYEIKDLMAYPNPYKPGDPFYVQFNESRDSEKVKLRIYTAAFRLIIIEDLDACPAGLVTKPVPGWHFARLASGTYYYLVTGTENSTSKEIRSQARELIILR